ncbi:hypothetical protein KKP04_09190 [Rhodomicrobium sp. Az07]|uniref:hypothetical protein n=1 Tax=Rhodomicrobium sp. Az07 TaxID=2839034 RepID=UPI001BE7D95C|nr:hypothetical protein [Rhodomicrobium sp. Az07]MBT3071043.1 hypothetical protein [Rhodomicrobium sp. Az07]
MTDNKQTDVRDQKTLGEYLQKRGEWLHLLEEDEHHSVRRQITDLITNDMLYRILNKARDSTLILEATCATNPIIHMFITRSYVQDQILAIRKLNEKNSVDHTKGVVSLRRLLTDIKANSNLITRENYVSGDGLPYDYETLSRKFRRNYVPGAIYPQQPHDKSEMLHFKFDRISGVKPDERSRKDTISDSIFQKLDSWMSESGAKEIVEAGNKYLIHAADEKSRKYVSISQFGFTFEQIEKIHRMFVRVEHCISSEILNSSFRGSVAPILAFGFAENLDRPYIAADALPALHKEWRACEAERQTWLDGINEELFS